MGTEECALAAHFGGQGGQFDLGIDRQAVTRLDLHGGGAGPVDFDEATRQR